MSAIDTLPGGILMKVGFSRFAAGFFLLAASFASDAQAIAIDKQLSVNVYQLCDNNGGNCASLGPSYDQFFSAETDKIWAQAGIDVDFVFSGKINNSNFLNINDNDSAHSFNALAASYGTMGPDSFQASLYLTHTIVGSYGEGYVGQGGAVIAMDSVMAYNGGNGRIDTIAHELGHNLGLIPHNSSEEDPNSPNHSRYATDLMADGSIRYSPLSINDIAPTGAGYDQIPGVAGDNQISVARQSRLLEAYTPPVPEPGEWAMMGLGLALTGAVARRRKARATA